MAETISSPSGSFGNFVNQASGLLGSLGNTYAAIVGATKSGQNQSTQPTVAETKATDTRKNWLIYGGLALAAVLVGWLVLKRK